LNDIAYFLMQKNWGSLDSFSQNFKFSVWTHNLCHFKETAILHSETKHWFNRTTFFPTTSSWLVDYLCLTCSVKLLVSEITCFRSSKLLR
jgi:hypothetical protein